MEQDILNAIWSNKPFMFKGNPLQINLLLSEAVDIDRELTYEKRQEEAEQADRDYSVEEEY